MIASFRFTSPGFRLKASAGWVQDFKKEHIIRQRHVKKYISDKDSTTFEETCKAAELFQKQMDKMIPNHNLDYEINTNQTRCKYYVNVR
jgi:hypothetical protein